MKNRMHNSAGLTVAGMLLTMIVLVAIGMTVGGLAIEYVVEFWASYVKKTPVDVPYFPCAVAGIFFGWNVGVPLALLTWILSFVL